MRFPCKITLGMSSLGENSTIRITKSEEEGQKVITISLKVSIQIIILHFRVFLIYFFKFPLLLINRMVSAVT